MSASARVAYLDVVRGAAITAVVAVHLVRPVVGHGLFAGGYVGVDIFFVLSGFLITTLLIRRPTPYRAFLVRRCRRLLPALALLLVAGVPLALAFGGITPGDVLRSAAAAATMSGPFVLGATGPGLLPFGIAWSLAIEWYFYLLWPLVVPVVLRSRRGPTAVLVTAVLCWLVAALLLPAWWFYFGPLARIGQLLFGCWVAVALAEGGVLTRARVPGAARRALLVVAAVAATAWVVVGPFENSSLYRWVGLPVVTLAAATWVWLGAVIDPAVARHRPLRWTAGFGYVSYSVYLWHQFFVLALPSGWLLDSFRISWLASVVLAGLAAAVSFVVAERPFLRPRSRTLRPAVP